MSGAQPVPYRFDLSPDCKAGKCASCSGSAWDEEADVLIDCSHPCHGGPREGVSYVDPAWPARWRPVGYTDDLPEALTQPPRWSELAGDRYLAGLTVEQARVARIRAGARYALAHYAGWGLPGFAGLGPVLASPALAAAVRAYADMERATRGLYGMDVAEFMAVARSPRLPHPPVKAIGRHGSRVQKRRHRDRTEGADR